jgi:hypothetical protein
VAKEKKMENIHTEEIIDGVHAEFDPVTGEFLGYKKADETEVVVQADADLTGTPEGETIH